VWALGMGPLDLQVHLLAQHHLDAFPISPSQWEVQCRYCLPAKVRGREDLRGLQGSRDLQVCPWAQAHLDAFPMI
jgi:hypothetical protein